MLSKSEVKYIQSLSQKKFREAENLFIIEGPKIVAEALRADNITVKKIFALADWIAASQNNNSHIPLTVIDEIDLGRISQLKTPNKVLALVEMPRHEGFTLNTKTLALALDGLQDPGNLGTMIRTADWFGITQIICSRDCADIYNHKVVQATMGSLFRLEIFYTELAEWLSLQKNTIIYGAALDGNPLKSYNNITNGILIIGNESKGIREEVMQQVQQTITIQKIGAAESLNAAVAAGIILSKIV